MKQFVKKPLITTLMAGISLCSTAQQKSLTGDQYFNSNFKGIVQPLPTATQWTNNTNLLLIRDGKSFVIDAKKGTEREATDADKNVPKVAVKPTAWIKDNNLFVKLNDAEMQLTNDDAPEVNPVTSPDGKYVAYTKNNDLYSINLETKKETRLTNDGSALILNGYASWVYMEEILGRQSKYRSFWWSPDSKHIAFVSNSDLLFPIFPIANTKSQ